MSCWNLTLNYNLSGFAVAFWCEPEGFWELICHDILKWWHQWLQLKHRATRVPLTALLFNIHELQQLSIWLGRWIDRGGFAGIPGLYPLCFSSCSFTSVLFTATLQRNQYCCSGTIWQRDCHCRFSPPLLGLHSAAHELKRNNRRPSPPDVVCKPPLTARREICCQIMDYLWLWPLVCSCLF